MSKGRLLFIKIVLVLMMGAIIFKLYNMQIINGEGFKNLSNQRISANLVEEAPRGEIIDRNGKVLVTNRKGYSIKIQKTGNSDEEINVMLLKLFKIFDEEQYIITDTLPITQAEPFSYTFKNDSEKEKWFQGAKEINKNMSPEDLLLHYKESYKITQNLNPQQLRRLVGLRYEMKKSGFSINQAYVIAEDVSAIVVSKIKERQSEFPGVSVTEEFFRQYTQGSLGAHILGRIGKIYGEEYSELKSKGYQINDLVGKEGIEKVCEEYLRGIDGSRNIFYGKDAELLDGEGDYPATSGNYVVLTVDANLQRVAEESLARNIQKIAAAGEGGSQRGEDADSGAVVVIDVKTGDVLALASYPTFDPVKFNQNYNELSADPAKPLWNRAISGTYIPGSTLKPLTAIAALSTGAITLNEQLPCDGIYTHFEDYQPKCWIWAEQHETHGPQNVTKAIENSCNCFFYETGRRTGIDAIAEYAKKLGLVDKTGIELKEEVSGNIASPAYKKSIYSDENEQKWWAGDTIQAAIGQSCSAITPIALANYTATIANGGIRYKTHIIKSVHSTVDGSLVYETKPEIANRIEISQDNLDAIRLGMLGVADEGSAKQIFSGYPIRVGGKTGTAQTSKNVSNNALFITFAPFDKPEIAIAVVIEHGHRGANAAYVARDIYDEYFGIRYGESGEMYTEYNNLEIFGQLLP